MFLLTTAFALSFIGLFANAKSMDSIPQGIAATGASFKQAGLVPDLLASFNPSALMTVTFPGVGAISPGQDLSKQQVATAPSVTVTPANSSVSTSGNFTFLMVDAFAVGTNESNGQILHWLTNFDILKPASGGSLNASTGDGLVVTNYVPPAPPVGTGRHRYTLLLFPQPASFSPPANLSTANVGIDLHFHLTDYVSSSKLSQPIAGMFFQVDAPANATTRAVRRAREIV